jgi:hypothetical protein
MRKLFLGYFIPTAEEFDELWKTATVAFDANVLLDLYRLTAESRQSFFDALEKLGDRIFLPNHAAFEYLDNRLTAITDRSASVRALKNDAENFVRDLDSRTKKHDFPKGKDIVEAAKNAAQAISDLVDETLKEEPDLVHSDTVLKRLNELFDGRTGSPYDAPRREDICKKGSERYQRKTPPGYEDIAKPEPQRYGDLFIWFELLDLALSTKKPVIFITRDVKEDWWTRHKGETISPRPELGQEMKQYANVRFYMYTTPRFLEFAQKFFDLKPEPTKKAASEFEKLEKQNERPVEDSYGEYPTNWVNVFAKPGWTPPDVWNFQAAEGQTPDVTYQFASPAVFATSFPQSNAITLTNLMLLPVNGTVFATATGKWKTEIIGTPATPDKTRACYELKFEPADRIGTPRYLTLWLSAAELERDHGWRYRNAIFRAIAKWLGGDRVSGAMTLSMG